MLMTSQTWLNLHAIIVLKSSDLSKMPKDDFGK